MTRGPGCLRCDGRGWVDEPSDGSAAYPWRAGRSACRACGGSGAAPAPSVVDAVLADFVATGEYRR